MEKSRFRSMSPMTVAWMIILLVAASASQSSAQVCKPASKGRLKGIIGAYDLAQFPASSFRSDMDVMYFQVWPENMTHPRFRFVCQDGSNLSLVNFTATCDQTTGRLDPRPYYDVGAADDLRPYYKHWTYSEIIPTTYIQLFCERGDMRRLYSHRIWKKTIIPAVVTTIVLLIILEFAVVLCGIVLLCWWTLLKSREATVACDHPVGHRGLLYDRRGEPQRHHELALFLHAGRGVIYTYLTFFAVISSFLRQVASACSNYAQADAVSPSRNAQPAESETQLKVETEGNDWRWQRVFTQFAVVMLMTAFLSDIENMAGNALNSLVGVIWSVVVVAGTWSIGVSIVIGARAVPLMAVLAAGYFNSRRRPLSRI